MECDVSYRNVKTVETWFSAVLTNAFTHLRLHPLCPALSFIPSPFNTHSWRVRCVCTCAAATPPSLTQSFPPPHPPHPALCVLLLPPLPQPAPRPPLTPPPPRPSWRVRCSYTCAAAFVGNFGGVFSMLLATVSTAVDSTEVPSITALFAAYKDARYNYLMFSSPCFIVST